MKIKQTFETLKTKVKDVNIDFIFLISLLKKYACKILIISAVFYIYIELHYEIELSSTKLTNLSNKIYLSILYTNIPEVILTISLLLIAIIIFQRWKDKYDSFYVNIVYIFTIIALSLSKENWIYPELFGTHNFDLCEGLCILLSLLIVFPYKKWITLYDLTLKNIIASKGEDNPSAIDESRKLYADAIIESSLKRDLSESYAVGICGEWGTGKTTFLNYIEALLLKKNCIVYSFNVWKSYTPDNIIKDFFSGLAETLLPYYSKLKKPMLKYADALTAFHTDSSLSYIVALLQPDCSTESLRNDIKNSLSRINEKIFILFDDIDRLTKEELFEVLRLIRNTANFPNLVYLVTYDKNYVTEQIKALNINEQYLNKIFMLELTLPKLVDNPEITYLYAQTDNIIDSDAKNAVRKVLNDNYILLKSFFPDMRQCERFSNQLVLDVNFLSDKKRFAKQIYCIEDLFWIELLKFYDRQLFIMLQNNPDNILDYSRNLLSGISTYEYPKKKETDENKNLISENSKVLLNKLFYKSNTFTGNRNRMAFVENYSKYFNFGLSSNKLNPSDFYSLIIDDNTFENIYKKVLEISNNRMQISLSNHILMTYTYELKENQAKNFAAIILSLLYLGEANSQILDKLLFGKYGNSYTSTLCDFIKETIELNLKNYPMSTAKVLRILLCHSNGVDEYPTHVFYSYSEIEEKLQKCVRIFLEMNHCDASDIANKVSPLYRMFEETVTSEYRIEELYDGPIDYCNHAFDEFLNYFKEHKSTNKKTVIDHFSVDPNIPEDYQDDESERLSDEIFSLFGSFDNYNKYLDECFE